MADDQRFDRMEKHIDRLGEKIDDLTKVVTAMARIEERMVTLFKRMDRYEADRADIADRVAEVEKITTQRGVVYHAAEKSLWLIIGAAVAVGTKLVTSAGAGI